MTCRFDVLGSYVCGELAPAEDLVVEEHLRRCADCRATLEELRALQKLGEADVPALPTEGWEKFRSTLRKRLDQARQKTTQRRRPAIRRRRNSRRATASPTGTRLWFALAVAAAMILIVGSLVSNREGSPPAQPTPPDRKVKLNPEPPAPSDWTARVAFVQGQVRLVRGSRALTMARDEVLRPGDRLETGEGSRVTLRYDDGSTVEINAGTALELVNRAEAKHLNIERGSLYVEATKQFAATPMVMNPGRHDQATILGTAFELSRLNGLTILRVVKGTVRFGVRDAAVSVGVLQTSCVRAAEKPADPAAVILAEIAPWRRNATGGKGLTRDLAGYWRFDDGGGAIARDSSGQGNHGAIHGAVWAKGRVGGALRFDGLDDYVEVAKNASLSIPDHVTVAMWFKIAEAPKRMELEDAAIINPHYGLIGRRRHYYRNYNLTLWRRSTSPAHWGFFISSGRQDDNDASLQRFSSEPQTLERDRWRHVAGIMSRGNGGSCAIFLDGKLIGEQQDMGFTSLCTEGGHPLQIGRTHYTFNGLLDEVRVYRRALSAEEIAQLVRAGTSGPRGAASTAEEELR